MGGDYYETVIQSLDTKEKTKYTSNGFAKGGKMHDGGKMKRDWSTYYHDGGMVEGYDVRSPYGTYAEGGTLPIGYHRMPDGEIMADSEHFAKGGYVCMNCGEYAMGGKVKTTKRKKRKR